jgi:hypothetical protein
MKAIVFITDDMDIPEFARISGAPEDIVRDAQKAARENDQYALFWIELTEENVVKQENTGTIQWMNREPNE